MCRPADRRNGDNEVHARLHRGHVPKFEANRREANFAMCSARVPVCAFVSQRVRERLCVCLRGHFRVSNACEGARVRAR